MHNSIFHDHDVLFSEDPQGGCLGTILGWVIGILLLLLLCATSSCTTTRTVIVESVRTDTVHVNHLQRDSIFIGSVLHDSIVEKQHGDTIILDRWHTRTLTEYRDRWLHDSIYISTHDTVPQPYPVEVEVPAPLTRWQQLRLHLANIMLIALLLATGYGVFRLWRRFRSI
jgi:hypothetical protein